MLTASDLNLTPELQDRMREPTTVHAHTMINEYEI